jgi:hypothetical protein
MKTEIYLSYLGLRLCGALLTSSALLTNAHGFVSTFENDADGWLAVSGESSIVHQAQGYITVTDTGSDWAYIIAPNQFHGDWSNFAQLNMEIRVGTNQLPIRVELTGGQDDLVIYYEFPTSAPVVGQWTALFAPLNPNEWRVFTSQTGTGALVTPTQWNQVTSEVNDFQIRLDLENGILGNDSHDIRLISVPEPASSTLGILALAITLCFRRQRK